MFVLFVVGSLVYFVWFFSMMLNNHLSRGQGVLVMILYVLCAGIYLHIYDNRDQMRRESHSMRTQNRRGRTKMPIIHQRQLKQIQAQIAVNRTATKALREKTKRVKATKAYLKAIGRIDRLPYKDRLEYELEQMRQSTKRLREK